MARINRQDMSGIMALICLAICAALLMVMCGCNREMWTPTSPLQYSERQMEISAIIAKRCNQIGVIPKILFTDEEYIVTQDGVMYQAAMWAQGKRDTIWVWNGIIERGFGDDTIDAYARHECCHCALDHSVRSPEVEAAANQCAEERY